MLNTIRRRRKAKRGLAEIVAAIFLILIIFVAFGVFTIMFNSFASYTKQANQINTQEAQNMQTSLSLSSFQFGSNGAPANAYGTSCGTGATLNSDGNKLVYASGMWFSFFMCTISGSNDVVFTSSFDGVTWSAISTPGGSLSGLTSGSTLSLYVVGTTIYIAASFYSSADFVYATGTLAAVGTPAAPAGTFTQPNAAVLISTGGGYKAQGPISMEVDGAGNAWVALTVAKSNAPSIQIYEHAAGASISTWSSNVAPTSNLGSLSTNAVPIILAPPSGISTTGAILIYETGSATAPSTGQISMLTTTTVSSSGWTAVISLGGGSLSDYSLTSSSAAMDGYVLCFAGLASTSTGATTGTLNFWSFEFTTSLTAGELSAETKIESASASWQAALTVSGSTLTLFDNPSGTSVQSYTSSTAGATWSISTTDAGGESAINGLSPAFGSAAVTWTNNGGLVRFLALSSLTLTNNSGFPVELVSMFVSNPAANTLIAIYFKNSSQLYDYWAGAGSTAVTPAYFGYSSSTGYLVTVVTSTGVVVSNTFTSLA